MKSHANSDSYFLNILKGRNAEEIEKFRQSKNNLEEPYKCARLFDDFPDLLPSTIINAYAEEFKNIIESTIKNSGEEFNVMIGSLSVMNQFKEQLKTNATHLFMMIIHNGMTELLDSSLKIRKEICEFLEWDIEKMTKQNVNDIMLAYMCAILQTILTNEKFKIYLKQLETIHLAAINDCCNELYGALIEKELNRNNNNKNENTVGRGFDVNEYSLVSTEKGDNRILFKLNRNRFYQPPQEKEIKEIEEIKENNEQPIKNEDKVETSVYNFCGLCNWRAC